MTKLIEAWKEIDKKHKELATLMEVCEHCGGTGYITVDPLDGEHEQYQARCECNLPEEEDETPELD